MWVACASGEEDPGSSEPSEGQKLCQALEDAVAACGASASECDQALVADCASIVDILSQPFLASVRQCLEDGGAPASCFASGLSSLSPSSAHVSLVGKFCQDCALGVSGCEDSPPMKAILPFSDDLAVALEDQCTSGLTCGAEFPSCAQGVLAQNALPSATAECLFESLLAGSGSTPSCGSGGSGGSSGSGGGGGTGGSGAAGGSGGSGGTGGSGGGFGGTGGAGGSGGSGGAGGSGGSGGTGGTGATGGSSGSGGSSGTGCTDPGPEPNDTTSSATEACSAPCSIGDADGQGSDTHGPISGVVDSGDTDYFHFFGNDELFAVSNAAASTTATGLRLCVLAKCPSGTTELSSCNQGTAASDAPSGMVGCCSTSGSVELDHNCSGTNDSADIYIRVDQANACKSYSLTWHF